MNYLLRLFLLPFFTLLLGYTASASHVSAGEILYECLGNGEYVVKINIYRDCFGIDLGTGDQSIQVSDACGNNFTINAVFVDSSEISQLCDADLSNSHCNGGNLPGLEVYTFVDTVTLAPCNFTTFSWNLCCRNAAIINLIDPGTQDFYIETTMNSLDFPCDNSPVFNNLPIPYVCANTPATYAFGVSEADGDSLVYAFTNALNAASSNIPYVFPYAFDDPIPGITLDPNTGLITFTATMVGNYVVTVLVSQYDDNGVLIGTIMRDMQFVVITCTNQPPDPTTGVITNLTGMVDSTGSYSMQMCEGGNFCFDFTIVDPDVGDSLTLTTNAALVMPGSTFTWTGGNPATGTVCWTVPPGAEGFFAFIIQAQDDACPVAAFSTYVYSFYVQAAANAGSDIVICGPQVAQLQATGSTVFNWTSIAGDPIVIGTNFSCNNCPDPIASPSQTTTYVMTSNLSNGCVNSDTVTVFVVPDFTWNVTQTASAVCAGQPVDFDVTVNPNNPGYVYDWTPATGLNDPSISDPTANYATGGMYDHVVQIVSSDGCTHYDTVSVVVTPSPLLDPQDVVICIGDSATLYSNEQGGSTSLVYTWTPSNLLNDGSLVNPTTNGLISDQLFVVTVLDTISGCTDTDTLNVFVDVSSINVSFVPDVYGGVGPLTVNFTNTSGTGIVGYSWNFDDGSPNETTTDVTHTFTDPGIYTVTLLGYGPTGCPGVYTVDIEVFDLPVVEIPNVFTPNGDGSNDDFVFMDIRGFDQFEMVIYNRWGQEKDRVSTIKGNNLIWRPSGNITDGTYFWIFEGRARINGEVIRKSGHVTLIR